MRVASQAAWGVRLPERYLAEPLAGAAESRLLVAARLSERHPAERLA